MGRKQKSRWKGRADSMEADTLVSILALLISILALFVSIYFNAKDHIRRRKQATIEYFEDITSKLYDLQAKFNIKLSQLDIEMSKLDTDSELLKDATEVLAAFERLCVGINTHIFDINILDRMAGSYLIVMYERFNPYIEKIRMDSSRVNSYREFERVVNKIKRKRKKSI